MQIFITLGDIIGLVVTAIVAFILLIAMVPHWWRKVRCKHDSGVNETSACDAICRKCGANLGFIGTLKFPLTGDRHE